VVGWSPAISGLSPRLTCRLPTRPARDQFLPGGEAKKINIIRSPGSPPPPLPQLDLLGLSAAAMRMLYAKSVFKAESSLMHSEARRHRVAALLKIID
jgi:hypothetical protein